VNDRFANAQDRLRAGNAVEAERLLRALVRDEPGHAAAWHTLALIAHRRGNVAAAAELMERAARCDPDNPEILSHQAETLRACGRPAEAEAAARRAVALAPRHASAHNNLALALEDQGRLGEAEAELRQALELGPGYARAHYNLGNVLRRLRRLGEAEGELREALRLQPRYPRAYNALGVVLGELHRYPEASQALRQAVQLAPRSPKPLFNLGNLLAELGRLADALSCHERALALERGYVEAMAARAALLQRMGRGAEAMRGAREAVRAAPGSAPAWQALGDVQLAQHRYGDAVTSLERALAIDPTLVPARGNLLRCRAELCEWRDRQREHTAVVELVESCLARGEPSPLAPPAAHARLSSALRLRIARGHAERIAARATAMLGGRRFPHTAGPRGRLRLGYLSSDFRNNAVSHVTRRLYGLHDRVHFEVLAYSIGPDDGSEYRRGIAADCDRFTDLCEAGAAEAAAAIARDGVDILVDLVGFSAGGRPEILAMRPAPVQVSFLYPGTMGGVFTDYFVGDPVASPLEHSAAFGEALVIMTHCYLVTDHRQEIAAPRPDRAACGLPATGPVLAAFSTPWKIEPDLFAAWMRALTRVSGSVLWLLETLPETATNLRHEAAARGVAPERLVFAPHAPSKADHLARLSHADLLLDTPLYNGHTTSADALWAGVPVITCPGEAFVSRVAASELTAVGLPELIVADLAAYEELAVRLASAPDELAAVRARLAANRSTAPLFDTPRWVRNWERALQAMWDRHAAGAAPAPIVVTEDGA